MNNFDKITSILRKFCAFRKEKLNVNVNTALSSRRARVQVPTSAKLNRLSGDLYAFFCVFF